MAYHHWAQVKSNLKATSARDFERAALPYLRVRWPNLTQPIALRKLDCQGIDLVRILDDNRLDVVVQCKGFQVEELGASQILQVRKSVSSFMQSGHCCNTYVTLYNRHGHDRVFAEKAKAALAEITDAGRAHTAELWDLDRFAKEIDQALSVHIIQEIRRLAKQQTETQASHFLFGDVCIKNVPIRLGELELQPHSPAKINFNSTDFCAEDPLPRLLDDSAKRNWTLVFAPFGSGKSTLSRRLGVNEDSHLLYVPASALHHANHGAGGENNLTREIIEYMGVFAEAELLTDDERNILHRLSAPLLAARLRDQETQFILLIDGIDEHRFYGTLRGLRMLTDELSRVSCQVILTTRKEHFFDNFGMYSEAVPTRSRFATKGLRLMELGPWGDTEILEYVDDAIAASSNSQQIENLGAMKKLLLADDHSIRLPLHNPLLLAIFVDLTAINGASVYASRAELYERWVRQKLFRDFQVEREKSVNAPSNTEKLVWTVFEFMCDVSLLMTSSKDGIVELLEYTTEQAIEKIAAERFLGRVPTTLYTTTSLLQPMKERDRTLTLCFFHRSFQEYFLASALHRGGILPNLYPKAVRDFYDEIVSSSARKS
jgi:hypothetical protein